MHNNFPKFNASFPGPRRESGDGVKLGKNFKPCHDTVFRPGGG